jgi:Family of unknown function (DUF6292)
MGGPVVSGRQAAGSAGVRAGSRGEFAMASEIEWNPVGDEDAARTELDPDVAESSGFTLDLLVVGYLSAVARELADRRVAGCRLRIGPADAARLSGSLDLEPIEAPPAEALPMRAEWNEERGWCVVLPAPDPSISSPRHYLDAPVVATPDAVTDFVASLPTGRGAGRGWARVPEGCGARREGRTGLLAELARYAIPEVRRWLDRKDS